MIANNIEVSYKSPAKIDFCSTTLPVGRTIFEAIQFDDICIKLLHLNSGRVFFIIVDAGLARSLLTRLIASSLIEDVPGLLFSSTEKGIFSFIIARLIVEMTKTLGDKMPSLKILGIFHSHEEVIKDCSLKDYVAHHFILNFLANRHPVTLLTSHQSMSTTSNETFNASSLLLRCGHIARELSFIVYRLSVTHRILQKIGCGDMIMFDRNFLSWSNQKLAGPMSAFWGDCHLSGTLFSPGPNYCFQYIQQEKRETTSMKALEIISDDFSPSERDSNNPLRELTENIRVPMSIELSRLPMSLKEISDLRPGQVIDLHRKIGDSLEIVIENKVIGFCVPVQIDGRLGIKVLSIDGSLSNQNS